MASLVDNYIYFRVRFSGWPQINNIMKNHLLFRKVSDFSSMIIGDDCVVFVMYNLSGKISGYQRYIPNGVKHTNLQSKKSRLPLKYKTSVFPGELCMWGLHTYNKDSKYLFVVEGVFDAIMLHQLGLPAIATLTNDPKDLKQFFRTIPQKIVCICDNDEGGKKLAKYGDYSCFTVQKDLNDMSERDVEEFVKFLNKTLP